MNPPTENRNRSADMKTLSPNIPLQQKRQSPDNQCNISAGAQPNLPNGSDSPRVHSETGNSLGPVPMEVAANTTATRGKKKKKGTKKKREHRNTVAGRGVCGDQFRQSSRNYWAKLWDAEPIFDLNRKKR